MSLPDRAGGAPLGKGTLGDVRVFPVGGKCPVMKLSR
jgi:hypothetical protein